MIIWQAVTADEYELPVAQADSLKELSEILERSYSSIKMRKSLKLSGKQVGFRIYKIKVEDNDYE